MLKKIPLVVCIALVVLSGFGASAQQKPNQGQTLTLSGIKKSGNGWVLSFKDSNITRPWSGPFLPIVGTQFCLKGTNLTVGGCKQ
jgi:hypothetical protein